MSFLAMPPKTNEKFSALATFKVALPILLCTTATAVLLSPTIAFVEVKNLQFVPVLGIAIYLGLISGYIPSPLYRQNAKWPRQYAIMQLLFLVLTASRLTRKYDLEEDMEIDDDDDYEYKHNFEELTQFTNWLGDSLHNFVYKEDGIEHFIEIGGEAVLWFFSSVLLSYIVDRFEKLRKIDETKDLSMVLVFFRNLALLFASTLWFIHENLYDPESSSHKYCLKEYNITPGLIAPDYPFITLATEFVEGWKIFHPSYLSLVRLSHCILYPSILLLLTRRRLTLFFIWLLFIEIDVFHMLADMFHYVSGPELAEERLDFQITKEHLCFVNVQFWQTMLSYPLNFVYLTTSLGDTAPTMER